MTENVSLDDNPLWVPTKNALPEYGLEVAVRGFDTQGEWRINGGVWWQPYKGQSHSQGRWMKYDERKKPVRLTESDDVTEWTYV